MKLEVIFILKVENHLEKDSVEETGEIRGTDISEMLQQVDGLKHNLSCSAEKKGRRKTMSGYPKKPSLKPGLGELDKNVSHK